MVESINNLNNETTEIEKTNLIFMRSENENANSEVEMLNSSINPKMENPNPNEMFPGNNENIIEKEKQNVSSPVMYYNYNGFIPYPYFPMQAGADGSFFQPGQVPPTANPTQSPNASSMFSSPHPAPIAPSMVPMNRVPSNSSNATPTNDMPSTSGTNGLPTPTSNFSASGVPPPMTALPAMPRMPYFPPQLTPSPLPMMSSNFNVPQPYSSPSHGFAPLIPSMNAGPGPMNGHRFHYNKGHHHYTSNNSTPHFNKNTPTTNNLYIKGLKPEINDELLQDLCKKWGTIVSSKAIIDNKTNECKGYGFVMYKTEEQAKLAMMELNNLGYQVSFAKESFSTRLKNLQDNVSTNIYMSNLPLDMNDAQFLELFQPFKVISHIILYDQTGASRGVGLAKLENREDAQVIIDKYANKILPGGKNPLQVRFADSEAQKKLKGQTIHKKNYRNNQDYNNPHQRNNMPYFNQMRGMNNFNPRNKMPFPPQMAYMAQPIWPMMGDAPIPMGMNNPYMMNPANTMNPQQPLQNGMMDPNQLKMQPLQEPINVNVTNQPVNDCSMDMNQNIINTNTATKMDETNFKPISPTKNMNHQGINFPEIIDNNAENNCIASAVESNLE